MTILEMGVPLRFHLDLGLKQRSWKQQTHSTDGSKHKILFVPTAITRLRPNILHKTEIKDFIIQ